VTTGIITTIAGSNNAGYSGDSMQATSAELRYPTGIGIDTSGTAYILPISFVRPHALFH
jgi:hypothetical protein